MEASSSGPESYRLQQKTSGIPKLRPIRSIAKAGQDPREIPSGKATALNILDALMVNLTMEAVDASRFQRHIETWLHCTLELDPAVKYPRLEIHSVALHESRVVFVRSDSEFHLDFAAHNEALIAFMVMSGGIEIDSTERVSCRRGDAFAIDTQAGWRVTIQPETRFCLLGFHARDDARLIERLTSQPRPEPLALAAPFKSNSSLGRTLAGLITAAVAGGSEEAALARSPLAAELLQDSMIALLLENLPHNHAYDIAHDRIETAPWPVRRAVDYIAANAQRDIAVGDVATAAEMSLRALQQNFQRYLKTSPQDYIKAVRLQGVHRELVDPASRRAIEEIAGDWGFVNRGHFATQYRKLYGELPSQTRRSR